MISAVEKFLDKYNFLHSCKIILLGFSGGADSTCLLDILYKLSLKYKFKLVSCHLNHNWRGEEALSDLRFCENFSKSKNIEFISKTLSKDDKHTETTARELRYKFFKDCINTYNADGLFLAHNKNDNAETVLYRIIKGTGIKGLCAMQEMRDKFYRPLLNIERIEIEKYCENEHLEYITDASNSDNSYNRNYLRNDILPKFEKINKDYIKSLNLLSNLANDEESLVNEYLEHLSNKIYTDGKLSTRSFLELSEAVQKRIILDLFLKYNLDYSSKKICEILEFIKQHNTVSGGIKTSLSKDLWLLVSSQFLEVISTTEKNYNEITITTEGQYLFEDFIFEIKKYDENLPTMFPKDEDCMAYVELTEHINFTFRTRRDGDIIMPLGIKGTMKLKKYLSAKKCQSHKKDSLLFLAKSQEIYWAPSFGISEKIKVVKKPTHVLSLKKGTESMLDLNEKDLKVLLSEEQIQNKVKEIAMQLNDFYKGEDLYMICVLKGSVVFAVDLSKHMKMPIKMEFIRLSSYGHGFKSTGKVNAVDISLPDLNGQNVLIVEDIIDTGLTAKFLLDFIDLNFKTKSTKFCSILDKKTSRQTDVDPDYHGFVIDDKFVVGYGLDYVGYYRNLPYIGYVEHDEKH